MTARAQEFTGASRVAAHNRHCSPEIAGVAFLGCAVGGGVHSFLGDEDAAGSKRGRQVVGTACRRCGPRGSDAVAVPASAQRPSCWCTRRSRPIRSRRTRTRFTRRIRHRDHGCATRRRHHCQAPAEKANPQADRWSVPRVEPWPCSPTKACCKATRRKAWTRSRRRIAIREESAGMGRHGCLRGRDLLQHGRSGKTGHAQARDMEGPDQADLQGQDRDAQPGVIGYRLSGRGGLAADVGRCRRVEVHGRTP